MRKYAKIISLVLIMCSVLGICSSCISATSWVELPFGIPYEEGTPEYDSIAAAVEDSNAYTESDYVKIKLVTIPQTEEGKKEFLKKVGKDDIAFFMWERDEAIEKYINNGTLASLTEIQNKYPACFEDRKQFVLDTSTDYNGVNYQLSLRGDYQGVFFNEDIFVANGLTVPKTWEQFTAVIDALKAKGITPIAAGFADEGMKYWMDELILMEGGVAEHSYTPKFGVVNSWKRAITDMDTLYKSGVFNADCMTKTYAESIEMFKNGQAAMIIGNSKEIVGTESDTDKLGVFSLPVSSTGKKAIGDIICDFDMGVYVNSQFLKKKTEAVDGMINFVISYLDAIMDTYYDPAETPEWSYPCYAQDWSLPANPYTIGVEEFVDSRDYEVVDGVVIYPEEKDPTIPEEIKADDNLTTRVFNMMENVTDAGRSMIGEFVTFDDFIKTIKDYMANGGDLEKILTDVTKNELAAKENK